MQVQPCHARIEFLSEKIWQSLTQMAGRIGIEPDVHIAKSAKGAKVVYTPCMVVMFVRYQHAVDSPVIDPEHLLIEVRTAVDEDTLAAVGIHQSAASHTLVMRVFRRAYLATATYFRHTN